MTGGCRESGVGEGGGVWVSNTNYVSWQRGAGGAGGMRVEGAGDQ